MFHVEHTCVESEFGDCARDISPRYEDLGAASRQPLKRTALVMAIEFGCEVVQAEHGALPGYQAVEVGLGKQRRQRRQLGLPA